MSEKGELIHHDHTQIGFTYSDHPSFCNTIPPMVPAELQAMTNQHGFDPSSHVSITNCLQAPLQYGLLARAFDLSPCSSLDVFQSGDSVGTTNELMEPMGHGSNSMARSCSFSSSTEAAATEDVGMCKKDEQNKRGDDGNENKKKRNKARRKGEKREREPRFAFLTRSELDLLEDGYRWRKYGQKAVKNSPFPRSYYRCTSQKCSVKKRVERSFQDPTIVITTYEGRHTHLSPATLRGYSSGISARSTLTSSSSPMPSFHHRLLMDMPAANFIQGEAADSIHLKSPYTSHQQYQFFDRGLLQDIAPPFIPREP